jgi:carbon-monoxide dehydrogenase large subunit
MFVIERLIDLAARRHGFDRLEIRRRNLVAPSAMPYRNPFGLVYDSGEYLAVQERAVRAADWAGFEERRAAALARGCYRGIGLANYIELNTGAPREQAEVTVRPEGRIDLVLGTLSSGQGHETAFAQFLADCFAVDPSQVRLLAGDSDVAKVGGGTHSGRSMRMGAAVMRGAADRAIEAGRKAAAERLEAASADIEFVAGRFTVKGTDRSIGLFEVGVVAGVYDESTSLPSFAYGCAVCEVEIDPETGVAQVVAHTNVDDCGRAINPLILHGQAHGGMAAGIGQALLERCVYDEAGQLQSATLMDYALPRADQLPMFTTEISEVPSTTHPLGLRGGGEGGTTPALGAVANAIADALAPLGVEHVELPATPERVWRAIARAKVN